MSPRLCATTMASFCRLWTLLSRYLVRQTSGHHTGEEVSRWKPLTPLGRSMSATRCPAARGVDVARGVHVLRRWLLCRAAADRSPTRAADDGHGRGRHSELSEPTGREAQMMTSLWRHFTRMRLYARLPMSIALQWSWAKHDTTSFATTNNIDWRRQQQQQAHFHI